ENIEQSQLEELIISDSIPPKQEIEKIKVLTVADLFAKGIRRIHSHDSISELFI
ncbi:MAG: ribose-phosphate pyrophosphokinase, partial [Cyclobacteriaceae bacterium]